MSRRPHELPDEDAIRRALSDLKAPEADADFRMRLRGEFANGAFAPAEPEAEAKPSRRFPRWIAPVALAAAALLVVVFLDRAPRLEVVEVRGAGTLTIGTHSLAVSERERLQELLEPGLELSLPADATLDLLVEGTTLYEVVGGSRLLVPDAPGRWFGRDVAIDLREGELRLKTGASFSGSTLRIRTPHGLVVVTGTLLSVQCDAGGTCVCVLEGTARVGKNEGDLEDVPPGQRKVILADGGTKIVPVAPPHRDGLLEFDETQGRRLKR